MNTQVRVAICRVGCLVLAGAFMPVFLFRNPLAPAPARAQNATATRSFYDLIPKHLPIKIKLKTEKEKDFLDIKNPQWFRNFVLEVRNTGHKPIYFLSLVLQMPDVKMPDGNKYGFTLHFGRPEFAINPLTSPTASDVRLDPGDTHTFSIDEDMLNGWEQYERDNHLSPPTNIQIIFNRLSFGDGTGFVGPNAISLDERQL